VGTYTLKTQQESTKGTFVWAKLPRNQRVREVWFTDDSGQRWTLAVEADGSLVDSSGVAWKHQTTGA
jgi:hypothetical protein